MSTKEKLKRRFKRLPNDFTFDELVSLMAYFGYVLSNKGKTSGSRVEFIKDGDSIICHKPHPGNVFGGGAMKYIYLELKLRKLV
ncbi:MAG: type II toxin-antitoxin system HicA family toxin [Bacteroidales bacterium]|nr:type II toxin-antitoxin system HicA family toxin [Bacteroidales bacterium]